MAKPKTKKLLWMKWYPNDWIHDTRELSPEAKAAWIDILCLMWNAPQRGIWEGSYQEFARATGLPWEMAPQIVTELSLKASRVTFRDNEVTLENRRMRKQETAYKSHAKRQADYRMRRLCDKKVTNKTSQDVSRVLKTTSIADVKNRKFVKPTPEELAAYSASIGYGLDVQKFLAYYEANGWKAGKNPMVRWQAAVQLWKANNFDVKAVSIKAPSLPVYKENIPAPDELMSGEDFEALRANLATNGMKI